MKELKIATWNISCGVPAEWSISDGVKKEKDYKQFGLIDEVIQKINDENIDIIGIQESVAFKNGEKSFAQVISEKTDLKYYTEFIVSDCHLLDNAYIEEAILSKYPIIKSENIMFENAKFTKVSNNGNMYKLFDDGYIWAKIQIDSNVINFITGHAPAFQVFDKCPEDYVYIYQKLEENISNIDKGQKTFIVGDYNSEKLLEMLPILDERFINHVSGTTFYGGTSIDYILAEKNMECISTKKIENLSDHLLCIASFKITE